MTFILSWNVKDILLVLLFIGHQKSMVTKTVWIQTFFKIYFFFSQKKESHVWNHMRVINDAIFITTNSAKKKNFVKRKKQFVAFFPQQIA